MTESVTDSRTLNLFEGLEQFFKERAVHVLRHPHFYPVICNPIHSMSSHFNITIPNILIEIDNDAADSARKLKSSCKIIV
jgi:hypothetical protein